MKKMPLLLFSGYLLLANSCSKIDKEVTPTVLGRTQLLTQKAWIQVAGREKTGSADWYDTFLSKPACEKDVQYVWKSDGSFNYNNGSTKCSSTDPQIFDQGTWLFTTNEMILSTQENGGGGDDFTIIQLDNSTLVFQEQLGSTTIEYSFNHP